MVDYVIIGGGVYGTAVAWELAQRGASVHLIEAKSIGAGASSGPGRRGVRANGRDVRELPLMKRAHELWLSLHEALGVAPLFECTGHLQLIERDQDMARAEARVWLQNLHGTSSRLLTASEVRDVEPNVSAAIQGAIYCPADGAADHTATTSAYAAAARAAGAVLQEGVAAEHLEIDAGRVNAVTTSTGERISVERGALVLANSAVAALIGDRMTLPVWNMALQVLVSEPVDQVPSQHLIGHAHRSLAIKAEPGNRVMISGGYTGTWDKERQTGKALQTAIDANVADAVAVYPMLADIKVAIADVSHLEAYTIDLVPIIDRLPAVANAYFATGWTGHGWAIAPAVSKLIAQWALEDQRPEALAAFSYDRFGA
jgi:sarcosine oxidase subunit beta